VRTKRILICAPTMPEFDRESGSRRIYHLITLFREAGWSVTLYAENMSSPERYARILGQQGVMVFGGIHSRWIPDDAYLPNPKRLLVDGRFDVVLVAFWHLAESLLPLIRTCAPRARLIVDSVDLHFLRQARKNFSGGRDGQPPKALELDYASEMVRELNVYAAAEMVLTVSQKEADLINDFLADPAKAHALPDMEELPRSPVPFQDRRGILFIGNYRHPPNVEAVQYLFDEIVPRLDSRLLEIHPLYVVGNAMTEDIAELGGAVAGARMVGWVPSVLPYFNQVRISIVPLTYGAGTKRKIIETLSIGTPCVSTSIGVEGLDVRHGEHALVADDPETFAASIERLLEDEELWHHLASHGRDHVVGPHGSEVVRRCLDGVIESVLEKTPPGAGRPVPVPLTARMRRAKLGLKHLIRTVLVWARRE
jgi:glycosyltransferase involved in cell wall biosynthesis